MTFVQLIKMYFSMSTQSHKFQQFSNLNWPGSQWVTRLNFNIFYLPKNTWSGTFKMPPTRVSNKAPKCKQKSADQLEFWYDFFSLVMLLWLEEGSRLRLCNRYCLFALIVRMVYHVIFIMTYFLHWLARLKLIHSYQNTRRQHYCTKNQINEITRTYKFYYLCWTDETDD